MKKTIAILLAALLALGAFALADGTETAEDKAARAAAELTDAEKALNIFTWTYYIPDEVVADFEAATGIRVNYTPFIDTDMMAKVQSSPGQFDIVVASDYVIANMIDAGLLAEIDRSRIDTWENIDPAYMGQYFDPENAYSIPYTNTIPLIVYDPSMVDFPVEGYADLWNEGFRGGLAVTNEPRGIIAVAEKMLGYSINTADPDELAAVAEALEALKPNIVVFNDDTPHNALIAGDAIGGYMYGSQIVAAMEVLPDLEVVYPKEGLCFGIDSLVMPVGAPHEKAAYIFLAYILDGKVSAYASDLIDYGNCNIDAVNYMTEEYKNDVTVNPPKEMLETAEIVVPLDAQTQALYDEIWINFRK